MAVKKTTKSKAKKPAAKKPAVRKAATAKKTPAKSASKTTVKKKTVAKKAAPAVKKSSPAKAKSTSKPKGAANMEQFAKPFAFPLPAFKEMEKIMTTNQPYQFDKLAQEAANQSRESMEAFVKSGTIFAKGCEELMKTAASMSQTAAEKQAEYAKQLMGSKTLNELAEAQNKIAQYNFDQFMNGATKLSEMGTKVLTEASEPINAQVTKAVQKANKAAAA